jgi:hypothetical protein
MPKRIYTTRRSAIVASLVTELKKINQTGDFLTDVYDNVHPRLKFWDEVDTFPAIHINAGSESREYQGGGYKDRFLSITVRCYVKETEAQEALDKLLEDVETVIESNGRLAYTDRQGNQQFTLDIIVLSIDTDEGVLEPFGVAEMQLSVHY